MSLTLSRVSQYKKTTTTPKKAATKHQKASKSLEQVFPYITGQVVREGDKACSLSLNVLINSVIKYRMWPCVVNGWVGGCLSGAWIDIMLLVSGVQQQQQQWQLGMKVT